MSFEVRMSCRPGGGVRIARPPQAQRHLRREAHTDRSPHLPTGRSRFQVAVGDRDRCERKVWMPNADGLAGPALACLASIEPPH
jgi:hypothetical protein